MKPQGFPPCLRVRRRADFLRVQRTGDKVHMRHFLVFVAASPRERAPERQPLPPTRLGITVTRKIGGAVIRNRIKRWVREAFRRERHAFAPGFDMVWVAKRNAAGAGYDDVATQMHTMTGRVGRTTPRVLAAGEGA